MSDDLVKLPWSEDTGYVLDANREWVATSTSIDAPLIVKAVNSYDAQQALIAELVDLIDDMVGETCEYMTVNLLGNPEKQHNIKRARAALAKAKAVQA